MKLWRKALLCQNFHNTQAFGGLLSDEVWTTAVELKVALFRQGLHTHISRKQPLPFQSPRAVPAGRHCVLSALSCWICGWCHCGPLRTDFALDKQAYWNTHTPPCRAPQHTLGMEKWPAVDLTFQVERLLRWDASSTRTPLYSSEPRGDIFCLCCAWDSPLLSVKGEPQVFTLCCPHVLALMCFLLQFDCTQT